jgi:hypothetical protein
MIDVKLRAEHLLDELTLAFHDGTRVMLHNREDIAFLIAVLKYTIKEMTPPAVQPPQILSIELTETSI